MVLNPTYISYRRRYFGTSWTFSTVTFHSTSLFIIRDVIFFMRDCVIGWTLCACGSLCCENKLQCVNSGSADVKNEICTSVSVSSKAFFRSLNRFSVLFSLSFLFSVSCRRLLSVRLANNGFNVRYFCYFLSQYLSRQNPLVLTNQDISSHSRPTNSK